jgi:small-conductance mechanosensitive channel
MIKNFQKERVIIPNSIISSEFIINRTIVDERFRRAIDNRSTYNTYFNLNNAFNNSKIY